MNCFNQNRCDVERSIAVFFTCGTCNLKCRYCNIDKNPILAKIDEKLAESFEGDYYISMLKKWFPNPGQLKKIETWGGEPFLHMERIYPLLHQIIDYYPYFHNFFSSTNFAYPDWTDKVFGLFEQFAQYPNRHFSVTLQLSMDGPEYINDINRGKGVSEKCIDNLEKLYKLLPEKLPTNVTLEIAFKQTLDNSSIKQLQTKEKIIEYYQYFENFYEKFIELNLPNLQIGPTIPNTAVPSPVTKEDGEAFTNMCKLMYEVSVENERNHYFKYYVNIIPYTGQSILCNVYENSSTICGSGSSMVCLLPDNLISTCHEGFTALYADYKKYAEDSSRQFEGTIDFTKWVADEGPVYVLNEEQYKQYEKFVANFNNKNSTTRMSVLTAYIRTLALSDQIEKKYIYEENAIQAAAFILSHTAYCIKDNYNTTGSFSLMPIGIVKLLLNGAKDYIELAERRYNNE